MTLIVEDGTLVANANTYINAADFTAFAAARSYTLVSGAETLLIQAMDYLEGLTYKGLKRSYTQVLQWPRYSVYIDGYYLNSDVIPHQLKDAQCQIAMAIDAGTGPLLDTPRTTTLEKVGDLEVQYATGGPSQVINTRIKHTLWKLLQAGGSGLTVGKA